MSDFLGVSDVGTDKLAALVDLGLALKARPADYQGALRGASVGLFFEKPSTRTRVSSEMAAVRLGAHPLVLRQDEVGLGSRESVADVARVLDRYLDVLAFRVFSHADLLELAEYADAPVINLLSDVEHPCQALADVMTIAEHRPVGESVVSYVGDGNNVCHSLMLAVTMLGGTVRVISPEGYGPDNQFVELAALIGSGTVEVSHDLDAVEGSDFIYTDVWASMGQESEGESRRKAFARYQVNLELFEQAGGEAVFLHCLPAHRGDEVTDEVMDHDRSAVFDQAENRMHAFGALLLSTLQEPGRPA